MHFNRSGRIAFFLILSSLLICGHSMASDKIIWRSFEEGVSAGRNQGKNVFLHFYSDRCGACVQMANETFKNSQVVDYLNTKFISVKIDTMKEHMLANQFRVMALPTNWFMDTNGQALSHIPGYIPGAMFLKILKFIHSESYKTMSFDQFERTP